MPDISKWNIHGTEYSIADATAREDIAEIESSLNAAPTEATITGILDEIEAGNEILSSIQDGIQPLADGVPGYFRANLNSALAAYKTNAEEVGVDGDSCIFITDTHWGSNQKHSPNLIRWLVSHSNLRNVFCGGDILDTSSIANEMRKGYDFIERFADIPGGLKTVIGNHDYNKNNHTEQPEYWLTKAQVYAMFYPKAEMEINDFQCLEPGEGYYEFSFYVDVPATNTRYLFVSIPFGSVYTVTKDWVVAQLTDNPTKNFVLISHYLYNASTGTYPGGANGLIYAIKGFSNLKAWLFGHTHVDIVLYTSTGIPLVCTDTDSSRLASNNPYTYTIGTITEQAFDIVTVNYTNRNVECARVGRGKSRRIHGGLNAVAVSGTTTLTPSITPTGWESSDTAVATVSNGVVTGVAAGQATIKAVSADKEEYWCVSVT